VLVQQISRKVAATFGAKPIIPSGPVLLVDRCVDSGWTLALASILLRLNGSGPVYPFALPRLRSEAVDGVPALRGRRKRRRWDAVESVLTGLEETWIFEII
jgi:hypothetical protein